MKSLIKKISMAALFGFIMNVPVLADDNPYLFINSLPEDVTIDLGEKSNDRINTIKSKNTKIISTNETSCTITATNYDAKHKGSMYNLYPGYAYLIVADPYNASIDTLRTFSVIAH